MQLSRLFYVLALAGCVPNGPSTSDAGPNAPPTAVKPPAPRPFAVADSAARVADGAFREDAHIEPSPPLGAGFQDPFDRPDVGRDWLVTGGAWKIEEGKLCVKGARNHPAWLNRTLPLNVRIEFDALSNSPDGDIKAEFFGDGVSSASSLSYTDATGYLTILGGWKNAFHVLARLNEHAPDRPEIKIEPDSDDDRTRPVKMGQSYHFKVERADGRTIVWSVGSTQMFKFSDPAPLMGPGHDHFGFNDWDVPVCFDNLQVTPL